MQKQKQNNGSQRWRSDPTRCKMRLIVFSPFTLIKKSPAYAKWCRQRLSSLLCFFDPETPVDSIELWHLELWRDELFSRTEQYGDHPYREKIKKKLSPSTLDGYVRVVKTLWGWLGQRRIVQSNPASLLQRPSIPELPPKSASRSEVRALLAYAKARSYRNYAIIRLLQATGIRTCGLAGLRLQDVDLDDRWVLVREKGLGGSNKARYVPFDQTTARILQTYLREHRPRVRSDAFFITEPRNGEQGAVTGRAFYQVLRRYCTALGFPRSVSPHMFRHFFGAECALRGMSASAIQQLMGHEDPKTTAVYVRFNPTQMTSVYDQSFAMFDIEGEG